MFYERYDRTTNLNADGFPEPLYSLNIDKNTSEKLKIYGTCERTFLELVNILVDITRKVDYAYIYRNTNNFDKNAAHITTSFQEHGLPRLEVRIANAVGGEDDILKIGRRMYEVGFHRDKIELSHKGITSS